MYKHVHILVPRLLYIDFFCSSAENEKEGVSSQATPPNEVSYSSSVILLVSSKIERVGGLSPQITLFDYFVVHLLSVICPPNYILHVCVHIVCTGDKRAFYFAEECS